MKRRKGFALMVLALLAFALLARWQPWGRSNEIPRALALALDRELRLVRSDAGTPGIQAAVVMSNGAVWQGSTGLADKTSKRPMTPDLLMATGSINKLYTAALILKLSEDKDLALDDPVDRWVPGIANLEGVTLRHLLTHTSGLGNLPRAELEETTNAGKDALAAEISHPKTCRAGTCVHYSNSNYVLLGEVVEAVTGRKYAQVLRERLLEPLRLNATFFVSQETTRGSSATGYDIRDGAPLSAVNSARWYPSKLPNAAGGLVSTARDTALFVNALARGRVLRPDSLRQMLDFDANKNLPGYFDCGGYGFGAHRFPLSLGGWGHGGATWHFGAYVWHFPRQGLTVAIVDNGRSTSKSFERLARVAVNAAPVADPKRHNGSCNVDLFVRSADGSVHRVTEDPDRDETPWWSPDGKSLVWVRYQAVGSTIMVGGSDGSTARILTTDPAIAAYPRWSPDGKRITFSSTRGGDDEIYVIASDGSGLVQITDDDARDAWPVWSPDGKRIAYASGDDGQIHLIRPDGSDDSAVTEGPSGKTQPAWSPDGARIAYLDGSALYIVDLRSHSSVKVRVDKEVFDPSWAPGDAILFVAEEEMWSVAPDGSSLHRVTQAPGREYAPSWSPRGERIAYHSTRWIEDR